MRFLLDENVQRGLLSFLNGLGHEVLRSPKGLANGAVFAHAVSDQRILVTHDKDFAARLPLVSHPGIVLLRIPPKEIDQLKAAFQRLLAGKPSPEFLMNRLFLVFPDRDDEVPFKAEDIPFP